MTYNQVIAEIKTLLQSHPMINSVKYGNPLDWMYQDDQPDFPLAVYAIGTGSLNVGREITFNITLYFFDKSGREQEFETEVLNDQISILNDIISKLRQRKTKYLIADSVSWSAIQEKHEDYLSGVTTTFELSVVSDFGACDFPQ